ERALDAGAGQHEDGLRLLQRILVLQATSAADDEPRARPDRQHGEDTNMSAYGPAHAATGGKLKRGKEGRTRRRCARPRPGRVQKCVSSRSAGLPRLEVPFRILPA